MNPASQTTANPIRNINAQPVAAAPVAAALPPTMQAKTPNPALLNLKRKPVPGPGDADVQYSASRSPSSRGKGRQRHPVSESRGQKRAIDGLDGPGLGASHSPKRQRESTPPGSPRGASSAAKTLVKTGRAVADLKAMASLSPRRSETASPPASPRTADTAQRQVADSARSGTATSSASSAPRWRSASYSEAFDGGSLFAHKLSPRVASVSMASVATVGHLDQPDFRHAPRGDEPLALSGRVTSSDEDSAEFVFAECDYGADGLLLPSKQSQESGSAPAQPETNLLASELVKAELGLAWQSLREAEADYLAVIHRILAKAPMAKGGDPDGLDRLAKFKTGMTALDTDVMLAEVALAQGNADDGRQAVADIRKRLAGCITLLMSLAGSESGKRAGNPAGPQNALVHKLQSFENACANGLDILDAEPGPQAGATASTSTSTSTGTGTSASTASTASTGAPGRLVFTHSHQSLLDDLDALMDDEIGSAAPGAGGKPSASQ